MPRTPRRTRHDRSRFFRCVFTAVMAVLLLLSLHGSSIVGTRTREQRPPSSSAHLVEREAPLRSSLDAFALPHGSTPIVSLQAACRAEMKRYCGDGSGATSPLRCLVGRFYNAASVGGAEGQRRSAFSEVCEAWLTARDACLSFVSTQGYALCGEAARDARECLRQLPASILPATCVSSGYYEGVRLVGRLREHQTADVQL